MPLRRALRAAPCFGLLALSACATTSAPVPWPPRAGSCVEAARARGRRAPWRYRILGRPASQDEVTKLVDSSAASHEALRRSRTMSVLFPTLMLGGAATTFGGFLTAGLTSKPALLLLPLTGLAALVTGLVLSVEVEDPFRQIVWRYNQDAAARGLCDRPPASPSAPLPPDLRPAPPGGLPTLPSRGWIDAPP